MGFFGRASCDSTSDVLDPKFSNFAIYNIELLIPIGFFIYKILKFVLNI
jgi:hypothetical protein